MPSSEQKYNTFLFWNEIWGIFESFRLNECMLCAEHTLCTRSGSSLFPVGLCYKRIVKNLAECSEQRFAAVILNRVILLPLILEKIVFSFRPSAWSWGLIFLGKWKKSGSKILIGRSCSFRLKIETFFADTAKKFIFYFD